MEHHYEDYSHLANPGSFRIEPQDVVHALRTVVAVHLRDKFLLSRARRIAAEPLDVVRARHLCTSLELQVLRSLASSGLDPNGGIDINGAREQVARAKPANSPHGFSLLSPAQRDIVFRYRTAQVFNFADSTLCHLKHSRVAPHFEEFPFPNQLGSYPVPGRRVLAFLQHPWPIDREALENRDDFLANSLLATFKEEVAPVLGKEPTNITARLVGVVLSADEDGIPNGDVQTVTLVESPDLPAPDMLVHLFTAQHSGASQLEADIAKLAAFTSSEFWRQADPAVRVEALPPRRALRDTGNPRDDVAANERLFRRSDEAAADLAAGAYAEVRLVDIPPRASTGVGTGEITRRRPREHPRVPHKQHYWKKGEDGKLHRVEVEKRGTTVNPGVNPGEIVQIHVARERVVDQHALTPAVDDSFGSYLNVVARALGMRVGV